MNKRFEQLKRKAVRTADTSHIDFDNLSHTDIQILGDIAVEKKLAELIVRKCIDIAKRADNSQPMEYSYIEIAKYFGVEE